MNAATTPQHIDADAYQAAERLIWQNRAKLVLGGKVSPQWTDREGPAHAGPGRTAANRRATLPGRGWPIPQTLRG